LKFSTKQSSPEKDASSCVVVGVFEGRVLSSAAEVVDRASKGELRALLGSGDMEGKAGTSRILYRLPGMAAERVLVVGLGKSKEFGPQQWKNAIRTAISAVNGTGARDACLFLGDIGVGRRDAAWKARQFAISASEALYRFDQMKSAKVKARPLGHLTYATSNRRELSVADRGMKQGVAIAAGMNLARDLGNLPGNVCTPSYLAEQATRLARDWKLSCEILEQKDMEKLGMGAMLSVAKGSRQPPKFIVLRYSGAAAREKPLVLIGKGITFDTGGISLKPGGEMDEMKFDMCGAASVIGTLRAVAEMRLRLNVIALVPTAENMPDGAASKPGDIVTSLSGQTIEILNTDAEGRLILCDALTYAERFQPQAVIDIATLTGACIIALGHVCSGLFSNKDALAKELLSAGEECWDRAWQLPLWDDYQDQLKSNFADVANIGGRAAGSVTAACFLSRFAKKYDWAHLDIAGTAWRSGKNKGASGRPVPLLTSFLLKRAGSS
jgi:leucyl aminopeptidase